MTGSTRLKKYCGNYECWGRKFLLLRAVETVEPVGAERLGAVGTVTAVGANDD